MKRPMMVALVGVGLVVGALVWLVLLLRAPTITYDVGFGADAATVRCLSIVADASGTSDGKVLRGREPIEVEEGGVFLRQRGAAGPEDGGLLLGTAEDAERDDDGEFPDSVLTLTTEQAVADCAARRSERLAELWKPLLLGAAGVLVLRGRRRIAGALNLSILVEDDPRSRTRL